MDEYETPQEQQEGRVQVAREPSPFVVRIPLERGQLDSDDEIPPRRLRPRGTIRRYNDNSSAEDSGEEHLPPRELPPREHLHIREESLPRELPRREPSPPRVVTPQPMDPMAALTAMMRIMEARANTDRERLEFDKQAREDDRIQQREEKVAKFPQMSQGADLVTFLSGFEHHMFNYSVQRRRWVRLLIPVLNQITMRAYDRIDRDYKHDYGMVKQALLKAFNVTPATYRRRLDELRRAPDESWVELNQRSITLTNNWLQECTTVPQAADMIALETLCNMMPPHLAGKVRDARVSSATEAAEMADAHYHHRRQNGKPRFDQEKKTSESPNTNGTHVHHRRWEGRPRFVPDEMDDEIDPPPIHPDISKIRCFNCQELGHYRDN